MLLVPPMVSGLQAMPSMLMGRRYGLGTPAVEARGAAYGSFLAMLSQKPIFLTWQRFTVLVFGPCIVNPLRAWVLAAHEGLKYLYSEAMWLGGLRKGLGKMLSGCQPLSILMPHSALLVSLPCFPSSL
jgi:hypothetical protein